MKRYLYLKQHVLERNHYIFILQSQQHDEPSPYCIPATQESDLYEQMQAQKIRNISMNKIE